jgi:integrase
LRERHLKLNAKRPMALSSILSRFAELFRLVRWLVLFMPELTGWDMVQAEHLHAFLLTLPAKSRGPAHRKLLAFFRQARKRRLIMHIPLAHLPSKELPQTNEPLSMKEQKAVAQLIGEKSSSHPFEAFLTILCFYYGLSRQQIQSIKLSDARVENGMIHVQGRPPIYLLPEDLHLLEQFLLLREELPYAKQKSYLVINNQKKLADLPLDTHAITKKVRTFSGHTPARLRMTCLAAQAALHGPQYLVDAFGISLTHASRFGKMEEFLLEEEIRQQRKAFAELSRLLE